jgi:peptide/nickel transport system substrate-binding protein
MIQANLQDVGINLELSQLEFATKRQNREDGNFDLNVLWGGIPGVEPHNRLAQLIPAADGSDNTLRYSNDELNALVAEGLTFTDQEARREVYLEAAKITNEELPQIWLWSPYNIFAKSERLQGFLVPGHMSNIVWNAEEWTLNS